MYNGLSIIVGRPHSGKSHLIRYLIYEICNSSHVDMVLLFSKSSGTPQYSYIPSQWQYDGFDIAKLQQIYNMQRSLQKSGYRPLSLLIIFDDCIDQQNRSQLFLDFINNHRHLNMSIIYSLQFLSNNISTNFREVVNRAFIFKQDSENSLKACREAFTPWIDRERFRSANFDLTKYSCLLVNKDEMTCESTRAPARIPDYSIIYRSQISPSPA